MEKRQASSFYQHFDIKEKPIVDRYVGFFNRFLFQNEPILTDFLNPREEYIFKEIVGGYGQVYEYGGYDKAEKKRLFLCDWTTPYSVQDFEIVCLEIEYNQKWDTITHSQILGVLTNLGVEINTFGDIISDGEGKWQFFVKKELTNFFAEQITKIGRTKVKIKKIDSQHILQVKDDSQEKEAISVSMRLDTVVSAVTNLSRSQVKTALANNNIKLNWHDAVESHIIINIGDVLSIQHFGRIKILDIIATKKGKMKIIYKIWQSKKR
ncbi:RNA-binding protein [Lactobacillus colini]|uniref:YlmH family RNA-binding protein n=1 Tax=Lactobacillus colini TaxID=1819254 RepID=UPI001AEA6776